MDPWLQTFKRGIKHALAGTLFVAMLLGGTAAVISALATGISSLTAVDQASPAKLVFTTPEPAVPSQGVALSPATTGTGGSETGGSGTVTVRRAPGLAAGQTNPAAQVSVQPAATTSPDAGNSDAGNSFDRMYSPIGAAVDDGGVVIGDRLQRAFGSFLSGLLQTLFLEQPSPSPAAKTAAPGAAPASAVPH